MSRLIHAPHPALGYVAPHNGQPLLHFVPGWGVEALEGHGVPVGEGLHKPAPRPSDPRPDGLEVSLIVEGEPLYLDNLRQGNRPPIAYVCGKKSGVRFEYVMPA